MMLPRTGPLNHRHFAILLGLSALAVLPFVVIHLHERHQTMFVLALTSTLLLLALLFWVVRWRAVAAPAVVLACGISTMILLQVWEQGTPGTFWAYPLVLVFYLLFAPRPAMICNVAFFLLLAAVAIRVMPMEIYIRLLITLTIVSAFACIFARTVERGIADLDRLTQIDPLTGAWNRRHLRNRMPETVNWLARDNVPCSLVALDIDGFKEINDVHGHARGDEIIVRLSNLVQERIRERDLLVRYGGDEFLLILQNTRETNALHLVEELRRTIAAMPHDDGLQVTISAGVAELVYGETVTSWMARADDALLHAKRAGRNRVVASSSLPNATAPKHADAGH